MVRDDSAKRVVKNALFDLVGAPPAVNPAKYTGDLNRRLHACL
jgi:hypothetical protein